MQDLLNFALENPLLTGAIVGFQITGLGYLFDTRKVRQVFELLLAIAAAVLLALYVSLPSVAVMCGVLLVTFLLEWDTVRLKAKKKAAYQRSWTAHNRRVRQS